MYAKKNEKSVPLLITGTDMVKRLIDDYGEDGASGTLMDRRTLGGNVRSSLFQDNDEAL